MATAVTNLDESFRPGITGDPGAVSWPAVFAGATAAASLSLILLVLGTGLGLSAVSPWAERGASATAITWSSILWIAFTALASSGLGGYIAGRLRVRWHAVHTDEVYFRDTAHGFLAWGVATLLTAAVLTSAIGTILKAGTATVAAVGGAQAMTQAASASGPSTDRAESPSLYLVDSVLRTAPAPAAGGAPVPGAGQQAGVAAGRNAALPDSHAELARIFDNSLHTGPLAVDDTQYAGQLVAQHTGLSQQDAEARVTASYNTARQKVQDAEATAKSLADRARKDAAYASLWLFISLLLGAFFASLMATVGGRRRDLF